MTEAELQRLAEIIAGVAARDARPVFDYWQLVIAFAAGILVNSATDWIRRRGDRRAELRKARSSLYLNLNEYRQYLLLLDHLRRNSPQQSLSEFHNQMGDIWGRIRTDLISVDDEKYARLITDIRFFRDNDYNRMAEELKPIIKELRQRESSYFQRLEEELYGGDHPMFTQEDAPDK